MDVVRSTFQTTASVPTSTPVTISAPTTISKFYKHITVCENVVNTSDHMPGESSTFKPSIELWQAMGIFLIVLVGGVLAAYLFRLVRKYAYKEKNLSEAVNFDAGATITGGLTAATIVAQWTWAATLLQSSNVASKIGISGSFWYASGATIQIILFAVIAVQLRVRAPGAKTFLRIIFSRFGAKAHVTYVVFGLLTNLIVSAMLIAGGSAVVRALVKDCPSVLAGVLFAVVVAAFVCTGRIGGVFYVSYFCASAILIIILFFTSKVFFTEGEHLGSLPRMSKLLNCLMGPEKNLRRSYNTFNSQAGLIFGIINIIGNFGTVFVDQSYWQIAVAAKPKEVVYGFIVGGLCWFAIPFGMGTTMGLGYLNLGAEMGGPLLTPADQGAGLVPAVVAQMLGGSGALLILVAVILAVISTAGAEVTAVSSIIVHDIYQVYLRPFRAVEDINSCILCGSARGRMANPVDKCLCPSKSACSQCTEDDRARSEFKAAIPPNYSCMIHGKYREYMDYLNRMKSWSVVLCSFGLIPLGIVLEVLGVGLGWLYAFMGIAIGSAVIPICLCTFWTRLTSEGMIWGAIGGTAAAVAVWLGLASRLDGGLSDFYANTGEDFSMLGGNLVAMLGGGLICVVVSYCTEPIIEKSEIWDYTYDIDSPLYPWAETYQSDLGLADTNQLDNRPTFESVYKTFEKLSWVADALGVSLSLILVVFWPAAMLALSVFTLSVFRNWIYVVFAWVLLATVYILTVPLIEEAVAAWRAYKSSQRASELDSQKANRPLLENNSTTE